MAIVRINLSVISRYIYRPRLLPILFRLAAITLGGIHTWAAAAHHSMNPDGIAYLDMGQAYLRGDWAMAINAYWSPLYSWLLGLGMCIFDPPMRWEFPLVHLVNFLIYLIALSCFGFFWHQVIKCQTRGGDNATLPEWVWQALGYTLFTWSSLNLVEIWSVTPDMCVAAFVYLAAGLILRIRGGEVTWSVFALLGVVLGLGYLSKAAMFPLAIVFLAISYFSVGSPRRAVPLVLIALVSFILVGSPFVVALSLAKDRLTFGDSGKLNYARYVNGIPDTHWNGEPPGNGAPIHPTREIFDEPAIYEFATPIGGTYAPWYDPSYWYEGVSLQFNFQDQARVLLANALFYFDLFFRQQGGLLVGVLILYLMDPRRSFQMKDFMRRWGLVIVALMAFGMYALVYVETRYLGPFVVLIWADLLANVRLPITQTSRKLAHALSVTMILFMLMNILAFNLQGVRDLTSRGNRRQLGISQAAPPSWPGEVAEKLHQLGVQPGDTVAIIGYGFDSFWARLAHVQIVAEMFEWDADAFWLGDSALQSEVLQAFARTGAKALVAEQVPNYASLSGWHRVGNSNHYVYILVQ
jgi:hypothetical protein